MKPSWLVHRSRATGAALGRTEGARPSLPPDPNVPKANAPLIFPGDLLSFALVGLGRANLLLLTLAVVVGEDPPRSAIHLTLAAMT